jgi:hypothetical protein
MVRVHGERRELGHFHVAARVATIYSGKRFHVEIDGVNVTGSLGVPVTGSAWDTTWGTVTKSGINLTAGPHIMRVVADTNLFDLNYFTWTAQAPLPDVVVTSLSYANGVFTSTVKNRGTGATPSGIGIGVGYWVDGAQRTWGAVTGPLAAGASVTIGTGGGAYTIPTGRHTIKAWVDDVNRFAESNEINNQFSRSIAVP